MLKVYWDARLMRWGVGKGGFKPTANYAYSFSARFLMVIFLWTHLHKKSYIIGLWTHLYVKRLIIAVVILGQNCVQLLDAILDDLFFSKICFIKSSVDMMWTYWLLKSDVPFYSFLYGKSALLYLCQTLSSFLKWPLNGTINCFRWRNIERRCFTD